MNLDLEKLRNGIMGLSPEICSFYMQACTVCLEWHSHKSGIVLHKENNTKAKFNLVWAKNKDKIKKGWKDMEEATEYGATAIALIMAKKYSGYESVERSAKGTGFDYWLGEDDDLVGIFQNKARLEISGILEESSNNSLKKRVKSKIKQTEKSKNLGLKAHICVTEFKNPKTEYHIIK
jgi:hypothetical protein